MNKTSIDWPGLTHTINPVVGCKYNCNYCYARGIAKRFGMVKEWTDPKYHPERVSELRSGTKKPCKVFVGSMCDMFGQWVPSSFIQSVVDAVSLANNQKNIYMFLTKNPRRYAEFDFPIHCLLGTTVTGEKDTHRIKELKVSAGKARIFVSYEPILGPIPVEAFDGINLIIIGADSRKGAAKPDPAWLKPFMDRGNVHFKGNVKGLLNG